MSGYGVVYVVWGKQHRSELQRSIRSLERLQLPHVVLEPEPNLLSLGNCAKIGMYQHSPFEVTLFLDSDTVVLASDLSFGFEMAKRFHVACCIAPVHAATHYRCLRNTTPADLVNYNSGVLFFSKSDVCARLFSQWREQAQRLAVSEDQPALSQAMYASGTNPFVLPHTWNFRPLHCGGFGPVKIWHGRGRVPKGIEHHGNFHWRI